MSERESRLLAQVLDLEAKNAEMVAEKWEETDAKDHKEGAESLAYEKGYSRGRATAARAAADTLKTALGE